MLKPRVILAITAIIISIIEGIYFYLISAIYKYVIFPMAVSTYIQILEKKETVFLLKQNVQIERKVYMYGFKGEITEEAEALDNVFFNSPELMKKTYEKLLAGKLLTYAVTIILGLCLMYFYPLLSADDTLVPLFSIFLMGYLFYPEIIKVFLLYKKIKNDDYIIESINIENKDYYSAFIEKETNNGKILENVYSVLF